MRKPVFGSSDLVRHKLACTVPDEDYKLESLDVSRGEIVLSVFAITAKLICVFVFALAKSGFLMARLK